MNISAIFIERATRWFPRPGSTQPHFALNEVSLSVEPGETVALLGRSGSGKSTLLNLIAGLDRCSSGSVVVGGQELSAMNEDGLASWRGSAVGIVFQFFQLLPTLTTIENVLIAMELNRSVPKNMRRSRALELLDAVGIADQADKLPSTLSGGQQQRAAIARALANSPSLILTDEPTGNLDSAAADQIISLLKQLSAGGKTVVVVTHDESVAAQMSRQVRLHDGRVVKDTGSHP